MSPEFAGFVALLVLIVGVFLFNYRRIRLAWLNPEQLKTEVVAKQKGKSWLAQNNRFFYGSDGYIWLTRFQSLLILILFLYFLGNSIIALFSGS